MKELSIEEKVKRYDDAIKKAESLYKVSEPLSGCNVIIETIFPELKESDDERIRKALYLFVETYGAHSQYATQEDMLAWLEKQGEQEPAMIQWKGNNLKEVVGFTGKDKNFEKWFKSFEEYERYVLEHNNIFKLFNADGSHYEVPVGAWIVKTPDGYNVASKAIFRQKPADKVEPKFHEGEWIIGDKDNTVHQVKAAIKNVSNGKYAYDLIDGGYISTSHESDYHLWTIQDAKDGDVLACNEEILLFKSYSVQGRISLYCWYNGQINNFHSKGVDDTLMTTRNKICPATKEQRDLLFQKMKEAGYEWDAEKKELKKIEQKSVWSEEDENVRLRLIDYLW